MSHHPFDDPDLPHHCFSLLCSFAGFWALTEDWDESLVLSSHVRHLTNHLQLQIWGIWCPFRASSSIHTHMPTRMPPHTNKNEKQIALHLVLRSQFLALHYLHVPWEPPYALLGCLSACLISTHWVPAAASCIFWQLNIFVDMSKCSGGTKRSVTVNHSSYVTSLAL